MLFVGINDIYPFDITKKLYMDWLINNKTSYKVRVYLLTCQNLSAIDSSIEIKSRLAGMQALCSADPFPVIMVGDGIK